MDRFPTRTARRKDGNSYGLMNTVYVGAFMNVVKGLWASRELHIGRRHKSPGLTHGD